MPWQKSARYWQFCKLIFAEPWVQLHRLVFADELDNWSMPRAARKQRVWAKLMVQFTCIYKLHDARLADITGNRAAKRKRDHSVKVFGLIESKDGKVRQYEIKKDGRIVTSPKGLWDAYSENRRGFRVLSGKFPTRRRLPKWNVVGTLTGRTSGRSPSPDNIPRTNPSEPRGNAPSNIRGTVDGRTADGSLFDFRTVRGSGEPLIGADFQGIEVNMQRLMPHQREMIERLMAAGEPGFLTLPHNTGKFSAAMEIPLEIDPKLLARGEGTSKIDEAVRNAARMVGLNREQRLMRQVLDIAAEKSWIVKQPVDPLLKQVAGDPKDEAIFFDAKMGISHETVQGSDGTS